jgi:hypothetical protein
MFESLQRYQLEIFGILGLFLIMIGLGYALWWSIVAPQYRRQALINLAEEQGWEFSDNFRPVYAGELPLVLKLLNGKSFAVHNVVSGTTADIKFYAFDGYYRTFDLISQMANTSKTRRKRTKQTERKVFLSAILAEIPEIASAEWVLRHEGYLDQFKKMTGYPDVNFDHAEEFSRRWRLMGPDEVRIRQVFNDLLLEYLSHADKLQLESQPGRIINLCSSRLKPDQIPQKVEETVMIASLLVKGK